MTRRARLLVAAALGLATTLLLSLGHRQVGYVRDEGIYFVASRTHAAWAARLLQSPGEALSAPVRDRAFAVNREHPALMKIAGGLSGRLFAQPGHNAAPGQERAEAGLLPLMPEGAAMRLPAQLLAGLAVALLFLAGASLAAPPAPRDRSKPPVPKASHNTPVPETSPSAPVSEASPTEPPVPETSPSAPVPEASPFLAGLCAALWFIALPHVWFHAGLHAFDVPVAAATLAVVLIYRRALTDHRWALALGPALGVAISIKHNALFIPVLLALHYGACLLLARRRPAPGQWLPLPFLSMALLAPLTVVALWPWLWSDPLGRVLEYVEFHRFHAYYNTEFLGINYNRPPLPVSYPLVLTWATVPTGALLLALLGLALGLRRDLRPSPVPKASPQEPVPKASPQAPVPKASPQTPVPKAIPASPPSDSPRWSAPLAGRDRRDGLLWALFAAFPLALIALPTIPIFGGTKHWLTAYPFFALAAASAWVALARAARGRWRRAPAFVLVLLLVPGIWSTIDGHPHGLSQYAPLVGGPRGAADLGLLRGFWGHALPPSLLDPTRPGAPIYLHDLHELARLQYQREGRWSPENAPAPLGRARSALFFEERHMRTHELQIWGALDTVAPAEVLTLDDVPLTSLYGAPDRR
jgi:hypothetical protein